jgi:hypothetical protein
VGGLQVHIKFHEHEQVTGTHLATCLDAGFFIGLFFNLENGGDVFLQYVS